MRDLPGTLADDRPGEIAPLHGDHIVRFYEHDDVLAEVVATFLGEALRAGAPALAIATAAHREAFRRRLAGSGIDVARALATGQLQLLDADEVLAGFMSDGAPDPARFVATVGEVVARAIASAPGTVLHAYGEMVDLLWSGGQQQAALQLEGLWNELGRVHAFALLCAYAMGSFYRAPRSAGLDEVCRLHHHSQVLSPASVDGELSALHERIRSLAREIELRGELEQALRVRIQEQERAEKDARRLAQLHAVTAALSGATTPGEVAEVAVVHGREVLGASAAVAYLFDDAGAARLAAQSGLHADSAARWDVLPLETPLPTAHALRTGEALWIESWGALIEAFPSVRVASLPPAGIGAVAALPLRCRGQVAGAITYSFPEARVFSPADRTMLSSLAEQCAQVLDRARLVVELRQTVQYHELFAGVLAHDLRGPLGAILTAAELLLRRQEGVGDRVTRPINRILSSGERMKRLIEQLLDFTSARLGGGIEIRPRPADLGEICRQVLGELEMAHPDHSIVVDARGDLAGVWDADRLMQVVSNLAGNAIQHGEEGALRVELDGTEPDRVGLRFENPGTVPAEIRGALFDPFRGTAYRDRRAGSRGIGLGLYITRALVQAHGGEVECESGGGTTAFAVRLRRDAS